MQMPKSKYEQTKVCDETLVKEMTSVQDVFSIVTDAVSFGKSIARNNQK